MEIHDVFADEVIKLGIAVFAPETVEINVALTFTQIFERRHITDRRIQPNVEIFAFRIRNLETKIWRIAGNIPLLKTRFKPFLHFVNHFRLQRSGAQPVFQHGFKTWQIKEEVLGIFHHRSRTRHHRMRIDEFRRAISSRAHFAVIAILIRRFTFRASTFHKTIRQEHPFFRIIELENGAAFNKTVFF